MKMRSVSIAFISFFLIIVLTGHPLVADDGLVFEDSELEFEDGAAEMEAIDDEELIFDEEESDELIADDDDLSFEGDDMSDTGEPSLVFQLLEPARFTLKHVASYKTEAPERVINNRSSFRLEYAKFFLNNFFLQFDAKLTAFWSNDHRAEAEDEEILYETSSKEAFLQASFGETSIKAGLQVMIWGESDGGAITDVISPRDSSELFFISLEESRIGQPMLTVDQYTAWGNWSFFYVPDPKFNEYPEKGTAYYYDPFDGQAQFQDETSDKPLAEYGLRWKKTFGKSDIGLMAAHLIDNDYAYRLDGFTSGGKYLITRKKQRYSMVGMTFNYVRGSFLFKGEIGRKSPKAFNDASYQIIEKDVVDTALGLEYSPGGTYTLSLEAVNNHVNDWEDAIETVPENTNSLVFTWSKTFFNEDLAVDWMTSYSQPYIGYLHSLRTSYDWDDNLTLYLEAFYPDIVDENNSFWIYRNQKQTALKLQYQF